MVKFCFHSCKVRKQKLGNRKENRISKLDSMECTKSWHKYIKILCQ
jgi:hypothetical protein